MIYCQFQMLIIDYSLDMFRAFLCPSSGEKTTCYCIWDIFAGSVGCGRLRYCGATLRVWSLWRLLLENNQHLELTINHLYCCILLVFFLHVFIVVPNWINMLLSIFSTAASYFHSFVVSRWMHNLWSTVWPDTSESTLMISSDFIYVWI